MADGLRFRSLDGLQVLICPFCARRIIGDPKACTFAHEEPSCDAFGEVLLKRFPSLRQIKAQPTAYYAPTKSRGN